jgi:hypothetical protein
MTRKNQPRKRPQRKKRPVTPAALIWTFQIKVGRPVPSKRR